MNEMMDDQAHRLEISPREAVRQLDGEIARLREELSGLVAELDRRRHEALDIKLQVKRHGLQTALTAAALLTVGAGFVWLAAWRQRRGDTLHSRWGRLRGTVARALGGQVEAPAPSLGKKVLTVAASAGIAAVVRKVLGRGMEMAWDRTRSHRRFPRPFLGRGNGAGWWTRKSGSRGAQSGPTVG
jgi:hypothetical protein